jgi:solute carrier family 36 (proton-coupled amino acid transporter)
MIIFFSSSTYRYIITPAKKDAENGDAREFDPFKERQVEHPTTDGETLTHLLKASLGTGILGKVSSK